MKPFTFPDMRVVRSAGVALLLAGAFAIRPLPAQAQSAERLSDKEVKALIEQVYEARDKFEGNLDGQLKSSTIRTATREMSVGAILQDLQDNSNKLKERFTADYPASAEVETLLRQATNIDTYMRNNPTVTKGRSEWEKLASTLKSLAGAYATTFPLPEGATVRRLNDKETAAAADTLKKAADDYKDRVDDDKNLAPADKTAGKKAAEDLAKAADALKSRVDDGKPSSAEAKRVVAAATSLSAFNVSHPVPTAAAAWNDAQRSLNTLQQAFAMIAAPPR